MDAKDLREKDAKELRDELDALLREQFNLRMQAGSGQDVKPHNYSRVRKDIARVQTVLTEKRSEQ